MPKPSNVRAIRAPRPKVSEEAARRFEESVEAKQSAVAGQTSQPDVRQQTSSADASKAVVRRRGGRLRRRRTIYLPPDLDARLVGFCDDNGREVSETLAAAVELYLAGKA